MKYSGSVQFGSKKISFTAFYVNRKTMEIAVHPNGDIVVKAPLGIASEEIASKVRKRARWILKQKLYFEQFTPRTSPRQYLSGETHLYLGRQYRLKIELSNQDNVKLSRGIIGVNCTNPTPYNVRKMLNTWYRNKAREVFNETLSYFASVFQINKDEIPSVQIRDMKTRWGSLSRNRILSLNINLIRAPRECIEYVIVHELCHITHHDHSTDFYKLLSRKLPDWEKRKARLEAALV